MNDYAKKCETHKIKMIWKGDDSLYARYVCEECINKTHWSKMRYHLQRGIEEIPLAFFFIAIWAFLLLMIL